MHEIGQEIKIHYAGSPISPEAQYPIGSIAVIRDMETGKEIAEFRVIATDDTTITGIITSVDAS